MTWHPPKVHRQISEERVLNSITKPAVKTPIDVARIDAEHLSGEDYEKMFQQAIFERKAELVCRGYGEIQHPTSRIFEIGIDSILAGKPSEGFLTLLARIEKIAKDRDVMAALFPEEYPRSIKKITVLRAQQDAELVDEFKNYVQSYRDDSNSKTPHGELTYKEVMNAFKFSKSPDQRKRLDRALQNDGKDIVDWRNFIAERRKR